MIFPNTEVRQILAGKKTQLRRPVWESDGISPKPHRFRVDTTIVFQRPASPMELREDPAMKGIDVGEIRLTSVTSGELGDTTLQDAIAEGHATTGDFYAAWEAANLECHVRLDLPIWIVTFELEPVATPHLLHRNSSRGYTRMPTHAMAGEGEAVDERTLLHFTADAHERFANEPGRREQALRKRATSLAKRLREDAIVTMREGHDIAAELDAIEAHLDLLKRRRAA